MAGSMQAGPSSSVRKNLALENPDVILTKNKCTTEKAKWLGMVNMYEKFHRPNNYDIGGTYVNNKQDYWLSCKTERAGDIFLLHIFVFKDCVTTFLMELCFGNEIGLDKRSNSIYLPSILKNYIVSISNSDLDTRSIVYVTTYSFTDLDIEFLKDRNLFIPISFPNSKSFDIDIINEMKKNHNYGGLFIDPIKSDFTIESSDGVKFKVHRQILSIHSDVFKAMFKDETTESKNSYLKIIDINGEDLKLILEFIYTGSIANMPTVDFVKLLILGDLYNLKSLIRLSQKVLIAQLSVSNVLYTLAIAHMYNADIVKYASFKFIKKNVDVLKSDNFKEITDVDLMRELCEYIACTE